MPRRRSLAGRERDIRSSPFRSSPEGRRRASRSMTQAHGNCPRYGGASVGEMASAPPVPPVTAIDLTPFSDIVGNARTDHEQGLTTGLVATSNDGQPDVALKGSLMVW